MPTTDPRLLFGKLNAVCRKALDNAVGLCSSRSHFVIEVEHWLLKLLEAPNGDLPALFRHYKLDAAAVTKELEAALGTFKTGNGSRPDLAPNLQDWLRDAWMIASVECGATFVRSGHLFAALLADRTLKLRISSSSMTLARLPGETVQKEVKALLADMPNDEAEVAPKLAASGAAPTAASAKTQALDQFTTNLTENAKKGKIDPVIGRDAEIRQVIDILSRRRQNNPILTGEAGVGKTAVVEGLALRIHAGDVPEPLKNVILRTLDLGLLQAGAGVKGEFENRLKTVIEEVKSSPQPVILFIDEAHTMIGAGGQQGQGDAANLLKPALARGELRTIAATTFAEYKKYFETDAALKRRFQQVKIDEPDEAKTTRMLRGLVGMLEKHHKVRILDEAVSATVKLSTRYMPDRLQPDKSVSLLDTVCARVALSQSATPPALEDVAREAEHLGTEIAFLEREARVSAGNPERLAELKQRLDIATENKTKLEAQLGKEAALVGQIRELRELIEAGSHDGVAEASLDAQKVELGKRNLELIELQGETPLVYPVVDSSAVAVVVSGLTGIPMGKMVRNELQTVLNLANRLTERVVGQGHALEAIAQRIRTSRADLADPRRPIGVFLLVGPSGVGKTETAMALADLLYGGDRNMVVVNMSEYKESHKVSSLVGTSKGYVGYGEGGVLTNAVKNRPYSVVLLDEVEKAHESVQEIFYQVFDKGVLQNDDGEDVNFKNTIILLTANVGTDTIMKACADPDTMPSAEKLAELLKADLLKALARALGPHDGGAVLPARGCGPEADHRVEAEADRRAPAREPQGGVRIHAGRRRDGGGALQGRRERGAQRGPHPHGHAVAENVRGSAGPHGRGAAGEAREHRRGRELALHLRRRLNRERRHEAGGGREARQFPRAAVVANRGRRAARVEFDDARLQVDEAAAGRLQERLFARPGAEEAGQLQLLRQRRERFALLPREVAFDQPCGVRHRPQFFQVHARRPRTHGEQSDAAGVAEVEVPTAVRECRLAADGDLEANFRGRTAEQVAEDGPRHAAADDELRADVASQIACGAGAFGRRERGFRRREVGEAERPDARAAVEGGQARSGRVRGGEHGGWGCGRGRRRVRHRHEHYHSVRAGLRRAAARGGRSRHESRRTPRRPGGAHDRGPREPRRGRVDSSRRRRRMRLRAAEGRAASLGSRGNVATARRVEHAGATGGVGPLARPRALFRRRHDSRAGRAFLGHARARCQHYAAGRGVLDDRHCEPDARGGGSSREAAQSDVRGLDVGAARRGTRRREGPRAA